MGLTSCVYLTAGSIARNGSLASRFHSLIHGIHPSAHAGIDYGGEGNEQI
jgi:hypothetical protein